MQSPKNGDLQRDDKAGAVQHVSELGTWQQQQGRVLLPHGGLVVKANVLGIGFAGRQPIELLVYAVYESLGHFQMGRTSMISPTKVYVGVVSTPISCCILVNFPSCRPVVCSMVAFDRKTDA